METLFSLIEFFKLHKLSFMCFNNNDNENYIFNFVIGSLDFTFYIDYNGIIMEYEKHGGQTVVTKIDANELKGKILMVKDLVDN